MAKLTDRQKGEMIADRLESGLSYRKLAKKYGVSDTTVRRVLAQDSEMAQKVAQKKEKDEQEVLAYMDGKKSVVCEIIGKGLDVLNNTEKLEDASPSQITTAIGTLIDKWTALGQIQSGKSEQSLEDAIVEAYKKRKEEEK